MFELGGEAPIIGDNGPVIRKHMEVVFSEIYHWFYGKHHSRNKGETLVLFSKMGNLRRFMKIESNAVAYIFSYN